MSFLSQDERAFAGTVAKLINCNPFTPERIHREREALGKDFVEADAVWNISMDLDGGRPNIQRLWERVESLTAELRQRLIERVKAGAADLALYEDLVLYLLYYRNLKSFQEIIEQARNHQSKPGRIALYGSFLRDVRHFFNVPRMRQPTEQECAHWFAGFFQIRRAFDQIFKNIVGRSLAAAKLRAQVWQSIFTHDMRRYRRVLFSKMADFTTLIIGPSGTGKELVARAIGLARFIPFDPRTQTFTQDFAESFYPLNLSALSPTLIESELFGHRKGAFTGAAENRAGWLEVCPPLGAVFLDEIGELDGYIQVKLLRVLQTRAFQRLGDTQTRQFHGKIIAATNRDLAGEMRDGKFRRDFYYRLCSDVIVTPSLQEQLTESRDELRNLIDFIARRMVGEEADALTDEVADWIEKHLGRGYPWPGNFRELEQCARNVLIRGEYRPPQTSSADHDDLAAQLQAGKLTADELLRRYCTSIYAQTRSYEQTARQLGLDRRTVKSKVDVGMI